MMKSPNKPPLAVKTIPIQSHVTEKTHTQSIKQLPWQPINVCRRRTKIVVLFTQEILSFSSYTTSRQSKIDEEPKEMVKTEKTSAKINVDQ